MLKQNVKRFFGAILGIILFLNGVLASRAEPFIAQQLSWALYIICTIGILFGLRYMLRSMFDGPEWDEIFSWKGLRAMFF
jgi:hypothetical protein